MTIMYDWHVMQLMLTPAGMELPKVPVGTFFARNQFTPQLLRSAIDAENITRRIGLKLVNALVKGGGQLLEGVDLPPVTTRDRWDGFQTSELRELSMWLEMNRSVATEALPILRELEGVLNTRWQVGG